jgi:hypothetical protein
MPGLLLVLTFFLQKPTFLEWAMLGSNQRPLPCEFSTPFTLAYRSLREMGFVHDRSARQQWPWRFWPTEDTGEHASCRVGEAGREDDDRWGRYPWGQYPIAGVLCTKASLVSCLTRKSATSAREM